MTYVVADLHGNNEKFQALLKKIHFCDRDLMYVLGDVVDFGEQPMDLIADLSVRVNVYPVAGEHDFLAVRMLTQFDKMLKSGATPGPDYIAEMNAWVANGGKPTLDTFRALDEEAREGVLEYLADMALFEETEINGTHYVMAHAGVAGYTEGSNLEDYLPEDFFSECPDPDVPLIKGSTLIIGHQATPTGKIVYGNGSIFMNCGVAGGGNLGCLCLETGEETYI